MTSIPLTLGPMDLEGASLTRSGLRWLVEDGHLCRPNEIVAFCNLGFTGSSRIFGEERYDLQVALAPQVAGRIRRDATTSPGGTLDRIANIPWSPQTVWAHLEPVRGGAEDPETPNLLFLAGRRLADIAEDRSSLFSGWHSRKRAWWGEGQDEGGTLFAPGGCYHAPLLRGDDGAFGELFDLVDGPAHVVMSQGEPQAPCAAILNEQLSRTPEQAAAIREDIARGFFATGPTPTTASWVFMGALQKGFEPTPLDERYDIVSRSGLRRSPPASAVCLSLAGEMQHLLRHRRLGYLVNVYAYRLVGAGEAVRQWLQRDFERVVLSVEDIAREYRRLIEAAPDRAFIFVNRISSDAKEAIQSYDAFDDATMSQLSSLRSHDLNLMLHDIARAPNVEIVDADAIAGDLGIAQHLPDAIHPSGALQQELRAELLRCLRAQRVAGFAPRPQPMLNSAGHAAPSPVSGSSGSSLSNASTPPSGHHSPSA